MLEKIHAECEHFWERHAGEIARGKRARIDSTGCSEKWMKNTQVVHDAFERSGCGTLLGPRFMCGLPAWLKDVASCGTVSRGYYIPPSGRTYPWPALLRHRCLVQSPMAIPSASVRAF